MATVDLHPDIESLVRSASSRHAVRLAGRERLTEGSFAVGLLLVVGALVLLVPDRPHAGLDWLMLPLLLANVVAGRVSFSVGAGHTTLAQLAFVPTLLLVDPAAAPIICALGMALSRAPDYVRGEMHPDRLPLHVADAWYAVAPAILIALWGEAPASLEQLPLYAAALAAQFAGDLGTGMLREWLASGIPPALQLSLFGIVVAVDLALAPVAVLGAVVAEQRPAALLLLAPLIGLIDMFRREREQHIASALALSEAYRGTALLMGEMLEADDEYTGGEHTDGVVALSLAVGRELGLDGREQRNLEFGALLHDIGKLHTPDEIINKPGKLTEEEWAIIKRHPEDGQRMLDRIGGVLAEVGLTVRGHHERWDGGGYPDGIAGEAIPLPARIICACDAYSAMTTNRSYRKAMPESVALEELRRCAGTQFDPRVVDAIEAVVERSRPATFAAALAA